MQGDEDRERGLGEPCDAAAVRGLVARGFRVVIIFFSVNFFCLFSFLGFISTSSFFDGETTTTTDDDRNGKNARAGASSPCSARVRRGGARWWPARCLAARRSGATGGSR